MSSPLPRDQDGDSSAPELSVIVLCYRAGESILLVTTPLYEQLSGLGRPFELILVANSWPGQRDPTADFASAFAEGRSEVRVLTREKQGAMGWDMRSGLSAAEGRLLIAIDGDAQNPVEDVVKMYRRMKQSGADVMKGRRVLRRDGLYRRVVSIGYNLLFLLRFRTFGLWDINGKPKAVTRAAYEQMALSSDDWFVDAEIVLSARELGLKIEEMPVVFLENRERASFVKPSAIWEFLTNMARYRRGDTHR